MAEFFRRFWGNRGGLGYSFFGILIFLLVANFQVNFQIIFVKFTKIADRSISRWKETCKVILRIEIKVKQMNVIWSGNNRVVMNFWDSGFYWLIYTDMACEVTRKESKVKICHYICANCAFLKISCRRYRFHAIVHTAWDKNFVLKKKPNFNEFLANCPAMSHSRLEV